MSGEPLILSTRANLAFTKFCIFFVVALPTTLSAVVGIVKVRVSGGLPTRWGTPIRWYRCFVVVFACGAPLAARLTLLIVITVDVSAGLAMSIMRSSCIGVVPPLSALLAVPGS